MLTKDQDKEIESKADNSISQLCRLYDTAWIFKNSYEANEEQIKELIKDIIQTIPDVTKVFKLIRNYKKDIWEHVKEDIYNYPYKPIYTEEEYEHAIFILLYIIDILSNRDNFEEYKDIIKSIKIGLHCLIFKNKLENYL